MVKSVRPCPSTSSLEVDEDLFPDYRSDLPIFQTEVVLDREDSELPDHLSKTDILLQCEQKTVFTA